MNYKDFTLADWIGHISGVIEDERELDGNEMRDLVEFLSRLPKWILTSERLPNKSQWVLVATESYQKPIEIMCYQGVRIGQHDVGNGWEEYEYPSWTSGHGDIQSHHPEAWMPLPKPYKAESEDK